MSGLVTASPQNTAYWLRLTLVFWAFGFVFFGAGALLMEGWPPPGWLGLWLAIITASGFAHSLLLLILMRRSEGWGRWPRWVVCGAGIVLIALCQSVVDQLALVSFLLQTRENYRPNLAYGIGFNLMIYWWLYALFAAGVTLLRELQRARERDELLIRAQAAASQAQLAALRYQLNPHFLFNTLNAISSLIVSQRNAEAELMMNRLSAFLRTSLEAEAQTSVSLEDELAAVDAYLAIESARYGPRLSVRMECPPDLREAQVPSFLLQPLVENAMKHAVAPSVARVNLSLVATAQGEDLILAVEDDGGGQGKSAQGFGLGLRNVRERLHLLHGARGSLETSADAAGFRAVVRLPLQVA